MPKRSKEEQIAAWSRMFARIRQRQQHPEEGDDPERLEQIEREFRRLHALDERDGLIGAPTEVRR